MNDSRSIELKDMQKDSGHQDIVRHSFRVPVGPDDDVTVVINGKSYQVVDISLDGISIACRDNTTFMVEQTFDHCELTTPGSVIKNLTARVVHFSYGVQSGWQNGIQWINADKRQLQKLSALVTSMKEKLLKTNLNEKNSQ